MSDFATREKNRTYYQEHREQILRATKEWRKRNREKYRAYQKEYWSKHYRNYGTNNRVADRAMRERKKPDVEKALSLFKNPQQAAHLAWLLENKKNNRKVVFGEYERPVWDKIVRKGVEWREMARRYVVS